MQNRVSQYFMQEENRVQVQTYVKEAQSALISELLGKSEISGAFQRVMDQIFDTAVRLQQESSKQPIAYIYFSYLLSSIKDGACELQIALYDKEEYLDLEEIYGYWPMPFLDDFLKKDHIYFEKIAKKTIIRVQEFEIRGFILAYVASAYFESLRDFCAAQLPILQELKGYRRMAKDESVLWKYGEFWGRAKPLLLKGAARK